MNRDEITKDLSQDVLKLLRYGKLDPDEVLFIDYIDLEDDLELEIHMNDLKDDILYKISKEEFYNFLYMQDIITDTIEEKTKELSMILYNRLPIGEMCGVDICESEFTPGCIFVEFEGVSCRDQFDLPIRFLWDSEYPAIFKMENNINNKLIETSRMINEVVTKLTEDIQLETYEKNEYERLKSKYE